MNTPTRTPTPRGSADPIRPAPDPLADESTSLLQGPLADAWPQAAPSGGLRERLAQRASASARTTRAMVNVRARERAVQQQTLGVRVESVYVCRPGSALRPGEPLRVRVAELAPGAAWLLPADEAGGGRDWLLMKGHATLETEGRRGLALGVLDHVAQAGADSHAAACVTAGPQGATVMLHERALGAGDAAAPGTLASHDEPKAWQDFAPLIKRRVLWQQGSQAAMLWLAEPGATVPQHRHGHDEECLMLRGDLFQDDYLLREGDYQLAPHGSMHRTISTDTGALIYAHGDLDMQVLGD